MEVNIDKKSGFCFGVVSAIKAAELELESHDQLYCLGDIVHNTQELNRLSSKGLIYIDYNQYKELKNTYVLIRAHGEPPETYKIALKNNIRLIDASCPVVLKLQANIRKAWINSKKFNGQIVICGKHQHPEVIGLLGQTNNEAIVVSNIDDLEKLDLKKPIDIFAQTTQGLDFFNFIVNEIKTRVKQQNSTNAPKVIAYNTTCAAVSNRFKQLTQFSAEHDLILFVSDHKSSNGKYLFNVCLETNPKSYFINNINDIDATWFINIEKVGISGATSTPLWVMEQIKSYILKLNEIN